MTKNQSLKIQVIIFFCFIICFSNCDDYEEIIITKKNYKPIICKNNKKMRYTIISCYKDGEQYASKLLKEIDRDRGCFSTKSDQPVVVFIAGTLAIDLKWIQFKIYCGDSPVPCIITPKLTLKDFKDKDSYTYCYFVPDEMNLCE